MAKTTPRDTSAKTAKSAESKDTQAEQNEASQNSDFLEPDDDEEEGTVFDDDFEDMEIPDDASLITGDVEGYWDPTKTAIRCKPVSVKLFDGNLDKKKPGILIVAELTLPCKIAFKADPNDEDWSYRKAAPGTMVGVWYKAGMRGVVNKAGVDCYIRLTDKEKEVGKPNPMKIYEVRAGAGGFRIPVTEDVRHKSVGVATDFDVRRPGQKRAESKSDAGDDDDYEFS